MGSMSLVHWLVVAVIVILLFGGSRFSNMMGDVAKGIKQFKKGMADEDEPTLTKDGGRISAQKSADPAFDRDGNATREGVREDR